MKKLFTIMFLAFIGMSANAQGCFWAQGSLGPASEGNTDIGTDQNGNLYTTGYFTSNSITFGTTTLNNPQGASKIFIVKYDPAGNVIWAKGIPGNLTIEGWGIAVDATGNFCVAGDFAGDSAVFGSTTLYNSSLGYPQFFVAKFDNNGNAIWAKSGSGSGNSNNEGRGVAIDVNGNVLVTGTFGRATMMIGTTTLTNAGIGGDIFIAKYDQNGNSLWAVSSGGSLVDVGTSISTDAAGNSYATGRFQSSSIAFGTNTLNNVNLGSEDVFIVKYDANGNAQWATNAGGAGYVYGNGIVSNAAGDIYVTGWFDSQTLGFGTVTLNNSANSNKDLFVVKYNTSGTIQWGKSAGSYNDEIGRGITLDQSGNVYATGEYQSWKPVFGTDTLVNSVNGYNAQVYVVKYNSSGVQQWVMGTSGNGHGHGISVDPSGNIDVAGEFQTHIIFSSNADVFANGNYDGFVAHLHFLSLATTTAAVNCNGGSNGSASVTLTGGTSPFSYSWSNGQTNQNATNLTAGTYTVYVTDASGCTRTATAIVAQPAGMTLTFSSQNINCSTGNLGVATVNIIGGSSPYTFLWSNSMTSQSISGLQAGTYTVTVTDSHGCTGANSVTLTSSAPTPSICMVTVDSNSLHNVIIWDKTQYLDVDTFFVYREISTNSYQPIAAIPYDSLSEFVDTVSSLYFPNTGDPNAGTYRYKIRAKDTCGNLGLLSPYHNTIYIINNSGTFSWPQLYTIESSSNPVLNYVLYRDNLSNGNWIPVSSVAGTQQTITDPSYATYVSTASWRVQTFWNITCSPSLKYNNNVASTYSTSFSNKKVGPLSVRDFSIENNISVYPTVNNGTFNIELKGIKEASLDVFSSIGEVVYKTELKKEKTEINMQNLSKGIYFVHIVSGNGQGVKKIVIE